MHINRQLFISAQQSLQSNLLRTGLTMLGIVIGIASVILITAIGQGALAYITQELSVFGSSNFRVAPGQDAFSQFASTANPITTDDAQAIQESGIPNIQLIAPLAISTATVSTKDEQTRTTIRGVPPEAEQILQPNINYGQFISPDHELYKDKVAVLGYELANELFGEDTNPVGESIRINNNRYRVIGVSQASSALSSNIFNSNVLVPVNTLITHISGEDELFQIVIRVENETLLNQTVADVDEFLREYRGIDPDEDADFFIQSFEETLVTIQTVTNLLTAMIVGISGISLVVAGVGVMNIMLVTVTERTKEIGLLKAIGAKNQDILAQFMIESVTLTLVGGLIGIAVGLAAAYLVTSAVKIPFVISYWSILFSVGVSSLVGVVFGLYPAKKAAELNPIDALRYE